MERTYTTPCDRAELGRAREPADRLSHAERVPAPDRPDPFAPHG